MLFGWLQATVMIALLQPAEETYRLFDDIMLLSDGRPLRQTPLLTRIAHGHTAKYCINCRCRLKCLLRATASIAGRNAIDHNGLLMEKKFLSATELCKLFS